MSNQESDFNTGVGGGSAALDQLDDDTPSTTTTTTTAATTTTATTTTNEQANGHEKKSVQTHATAIGVIIPPDEIKSLIEKTGDFVRKGGEQFLSETKNRTAGQKKFAFLHEGHPYYPFFMQYVKYGKEGPPPELVTSSIPLPKQQQQQEEKKKMADEAEQNKKESVAAASQKKLSLTERLMLELANVKIVDPDLLRTLPILPASIQQEEQKNSLTNDSFRRKETDEENDPSAFHFNVKFPAHLSAVDIDVLKLTAQWGARNGMDFLNGLATREKRNPAFDFLKQTHPHFKIFKSLLEVYKQIIVKDNERIANMKNHQEQPNQVLREFIIHAERRKAVLSSSSANSNLNTLTSFTVDWHNFVCIDTITFDSEEIEYLPIAKMTIEEMNLLLNSGGEDEVEEEMDMDVDMDMDMDDDRDEQDEQNKLKAEQERRDIDSIIAMLPTEEGLEIREAVDEDETVENSLFTVRNSDNAVKFQKCPVCGDEIAIDDLAEHVRIELLDPKWKEQKQSLLDKQRESSLASDSTIAENLKRLQKRKKVSESDLKKDEERERKQAAQDAALLFGRQHPAVRKDNDNEGANSADTAKSTTSASSQPVPNPSSSSSSTATATTNTSLPLPTPSSFVGVPPPPPPPRPAPGGAPGAPGLLAPPTIRVLPPTNVPPPPPPPPGPRPPLIAPSSMYVGPPGIPAPLLPVPSLLGAVPPPPGVSAVSIAPPVAAAPVLPHAPPTVAVPTSNNTEEHASKRARVSALDLASQSGGAGAAAGAAKSNLIPEAEFLAKNSSPISVTVSIPNDSDCSFNFVGQTIPLSGMSLTDTVLSLKEKLSSHLNQIPPNKVKLQLTSTGVFLAKDNLTLAFYNVTNNANISLGLKERGGKKK